MQNTLVVQQKTISSFYWQHALSALLLEMHRINNFEVPKWIYIIQHKYTGGQVIPYPLFSGKHFYCLSPPSWKIPGTYDTSFENPNKKLLESGKKFGVASPWGWPHPLNWKSTTFTKTCVEPLMTEILQVSNILSIGTL